MIQLTEKIKKSILHMKFELHYTTGDIIRAHPGLHKKQIQSIAAEHKQKLAEEDLNLEVNLMLLGDL